MPTVTPPRPPGKFPADRLELLLRWDDVRRSLSNPAVVLDCEEFAILLNVFEQLRKSGEPLDPMLVALIDALCRQLVDLCEDNEPDITDNEIDDAEDECEEGGAGNENEPATYREGTFQGKHHCTRDGHRLMAEARRFMQRRRQNHYLMPKRRQGNPEPSAPAA